MPNTLTLIQSFTAGAGGVSNFTFTSIPNTYTDLLIKFSTRETTGGYAQNLKINFNSNTANYTDIILYGMATTSPYVFGSKNSSPTGTFGSFQYSVSSVSGSANAFSIGDIYIPNYTGSQGKMWAWDGGSENNAAATIFGFTGGLWSNSAAITSIVLASEGGGTLLQNSSAYLYGIVKS